MNTSYDKLLPAGIIFNLKEIEAMNLIKVAMAKKLISQGNLEIIKVGNKVHVSRVELIRFLESNTLKITG